MIQISHLSKSYPNQVIFNDISFSINKKEKIGLIGKNGHGKSTLLRIIDGSESSDSGKVLISKHYHISHLAQELVFTKKTVLEEVLSSDKEHIDEKWKAEKILFGLDFTSKQIHLSPYELSGGWMNRINLAKVLMSNADLLLLDEPTNHLDLPSVEWLIKFLKGWQKELILISHDQEFMDSIITHTLGIHRQSVRKIAGISKKLYEQIAQEELSYKKKTIQNKKEAVHIENFIKRFKSKAKLAKMAQSRIKTLEKRDKLEELDVIPVLDFSFSFQDFEVQTMMNIKNISFGYQSKTMLIKNLEFHVDKGDKIAIIGKNGTGKSTLLKLLLKKLSPLSGEIQYHPSLCMTYYGQISEHELNPHLSIEEEISYALPQGEKHKARHIAGAMMFSRDIALKKCNVLSGGEKARVVLAKIIAQPTHCLLLDEPSNHLDIESTKSLMDALAEFQGSVIFVTHNKTILQRLATKLIVFDSEQPYIYPGTYQEFMDNIGFTHNQAINSSKKEQKNKKVKIKAPSLQKDIEKIEKEIAQQELHLKDLELSLSEGATTLSYEEIQNISLEMHKVIENIEIAYTLLDKKMNNLSE